MQADFGEFYKSVSKPLTEQAELNINTMSKWAKNSNVLEKLSHAKKPEEYFELVNTAALEGMKFWEETFKIWGNAFSQATHACANTMRETTKRSDNERPSKF